VSNYRICLVSDTMDNLDEVVEWACRTQKRSNLELLCASWPGGWSAVTYHIWAQRNARTHGGIPKSDEGLIQVIKWEIRTRMAAKDRIPKSLLNRVLCCNWGTTTSVITI
jgi:hypothetical protein